VVAPPKIVRPVVVAPAPIVDDASEYNPAIKPISVFVAFAAVAPKVVVVNGKANDAAADPVKHTPFIEKHPPARSIPRAKVEVAAVPVTFKYAVESPAVSVEVAGPVTYKDEVVAYEAKKLVEEAVVAKKFVAVAFWSVDEPLTKKLFAKKKPVEVALPKSARVANDWVLEAVEAKSAVEVPWPPEKKRLVVDATVAKKAVEVALVVVALMPVKF
jgi:hypothetical protein